MIELDWGTIRNPMFQQAFGELLRQKHPFKVSYMLSRIQKAIESEHKFSQEEWMKLVKKHADIDEKGNYKVREENMEQWAKDMEEFAKVKFKVEKNKLPWSAFAGSVSGLDISLLEGIIDFTGIEEEPKAPTPIKAVEAQAELNH